MEQFVFKITLAFIGGLCMMWIIPIALSVWGINAQISNPIVNAFIFIIMPFAVAFVGIYKIIQLFTEGGTPA